VIYQILLIAIASIVFIHVVGSIIVHKVSNYLFERKITKALRTKEGKAMLAEAMLKPIRDNMNYSSLSNNNDSVQN